MNNKILNYENKTIINNINQINGNKQNDYKIYNNMIDHFVFNNENVNEEDKKNLLKNKKSESVNNNNIEKNNKDKKIERKNIIIKKDIINDLNDKFLKISFKKVKLLNKK